VLFNENIFRYFIVHFLSRERKQNQKKAPVSRALRVRLRVVVAAGRAETRPAYQRDSDSRRVFFVCNPDARPRDKGGFPSQA